MREKAKFLYKYILFIPTLVCVYSCSSLKAPRQKNDTVQSAQSTMQSTHGDYPTTASKIEFKKIAQDTLILLKEIEAYGTDTPVGQVSGMALLGNNVYVSQYKEGKIFVLDKNTFDFKFSIGDGPGDSTGNLNKPFCPLTYEGNLLVPHYLGPYLLSVFSPDGKFVKAIKRPRYRFNYSSDIQSCFIKDSTIFFSKLIAYGLTKAELVTLKDSVARSVKTMLPVEDFEAKADSSVLRMKLIRLFLTPSAKQNKFFAIPGNKPLINSYSYDGKLLNSVDLRSIPLFDIYYRNLKDYFVGTEGLEVFSPSASVNITYFNSIVSDDKDNIYFQAAEVTNLRQFLNKEIPVDSLKTKAYIVAVNVDNQQYKVYPCDSKRALHPLKVIGNQLWSWDRVKSSIVIHDLGNKL